jgi:hypothetical protein
MPLMQTQPLAPPPLGNAAPVGGAPLALVVAEPLGAIGARPETAWMAKRFDGSGLLFGALAVLGAVLAVLLLLGWSSSSALLVDYTVHAPVSNLQVRIDNGTLMFGVFANDDRPRGWFRPPRARLSDLSPPVSMTMDLFGWGFAAPAWAPAIGFATLPAWWWIVHRQRRMLRQWIAASRCLHCGYDLRASGRICPECGERAGSLPADALL